MLKFKKISIIIVNYRSQDRLRACVASIFEKFKNKNFEILIINNDKEENIVKVLGKSPEIQVVNLGKNVGFGKAINVGAKIARGEWLLFLNPDTKMLTNQDKFFSFFEATKEAGVISPKLIEESGEAQKWSAGTDPSLLDLIKNNLGLAKSKKVWESQKVRKVDWVSGAAMVIKKNLFDKIGGFDENIFMYYEDIDLCKRVREAGREVFYFPQEKVLHLGGRSTENEEKQKTDYYKSQEYYFQKHFGRSHSCCVHFLRKFFIKT
jgi:GT2 family glycosyltransferase